MSDLQASGDGRKETPLERLDRNLEELTGELRVIATACRCCSPSF